MARTPRYHKADAPEKHTRKVKPSHKKGVSGPICVASAHSRAWFCGKGRIVVSQSSIEDWPWRRLRRGFCVCCRGLVSFLCSVLGVMFEAARNLEGDT